MARLTGAGLAVQRVAGSLRLAASRRRHALPGPSRHVSAVVRLPEAHARQIAQALAPLRELASRHWVYPPDALHLTVCNLDAVGADAPAVIRRVLRATAPFELELRGLNVTGHSVFVQALPFDGSLLAIRRRLGARQALGFGHVNVVRFEGRVEPRLLAAVARARSLQLGRLRVGEVEIVDTDQLFLRPVTVERIALGAH